MITETTPDETPDEAAPADDGTPKDTGQESNPNAEAARYRTRLRETEAERDGFAERLLGYQRREAERLAGVELAKPSDLWLDGRDVADLLDDEGHVDPAKVADEVGSVTAERPLLRSTRPRPRPDSTQGSPMPQSTGDWQQVLRGAKR